MRRALAIATGVLVCGLARAAPEPRGATAASVATKVGTAAEAQARDLFERGLEAARARQWADAEPLFERSAAIVPRASTLYNLALSRFRLERPEACIDAIDRLLGSNDESGATYREYAEELRRRALERVLVLELTVDPPEAVVFVDGVGRPGFGSHRTLVTSPGSHRLDVSERTYSPVHISFSGAAGETSSQSVRLAGLPRADARSRNGVAVSETPHGPVKGVLAKTSGHYGGPSTASWILFATGSALLIGAAVTGAIAWKADEDFVDACPVPSQCPESARPLQAKARDFALACDVLLGAGLAAGGVGGVLWWSAGRPASNGPSALGVRIQGRF